MSGIVGKQPLAMHEVQQIALGVLKRIAEVCEREGFRYTLAFGTLIGAIRHHGFIPWDDDIDILMPRPDYENFLTYMVKHPLDNLKVFNHKYVKGYPLGISRICDMRYKIEGAGSDFVDMGIFVDVYPLDGLANTYEEAKQAFCYTDKSRANLLRLMGKTSDSLSLKNFIKNPRYYLSTVKLRIQGLSFIQRKLEKEACQRPFASYSYIGVSNWNWAHIVFQRDWFNEFRRATFENHEFNIITHYDEMLREEYGDYMQLPPEEKRVYHHQYLAYYRQ